MNEHPIEGIMNTAMESIRNMVDVNTIIGEPIETINNVTIIPVSKVCFGFAAGGSEFSNKCMCGYKKKSKEEEIEEKLPFGGGSGAGVSISPVGFIVIGSDTASCPKFISVEHKCSVDKLLEYVPDLIEKVTKAIEKMCNKQNEKEENINKPLSNTDYKFDYTEDDLQSDTQEKNLEDDE